MSAIGSSSSWQDRFLCLLPAVRRYASIRFGSFPSDLRTEAVQEAIAAACLTCQRAAINGRLDAIRPGPLADFAVRHVRTGRHVGGRQDGPDDLLSPACHKRYKVTRIRGESQAADDDGRWWQMTIPQRSGSVADLAAFRIDFSHWLTTLSPRDRKIVRWLAAGEAPSAVAARLGISPGRISQLRHHYHSNWLVFQGEIPAEIAA